MRRLAATLVLAIAGCFQPPAPAVLVFERSEIDLGEVLAGESHRVVFPFENLGGENLVISKIETSCRCTDANVTQSTLEPQAKAELIVLTKPSGTGEHRADIALHSNSDEGAARQVCVKWNGVAPVELAPTRIDLGSIPTGTRQSIPFAILARPALLASPAPCLVAMSPVEAPVTCTLSQLELHERVEGVVDVDAGEQTGEAQRTVEFLVSGGWSGTLTLHVTWTVRDHLLAIPRRLSLGVGRPGTEMAGTIRLRSDDGPLAVESVQVEAVHWRPGVRISPVSETESHLQVTATLPSSVGIYEATARVQYRQPQAGEMLIPIVATVRDQGASP